MVSRVGRHPSAAAEGIDSTLISGIIAALSLRPITHHGQHPYWDIRMALQALGRKVLSGKISWAKDARLLLRAVGYGRDQQQLLHAAKDRNALRLARGNAEELRICDQSEPLPNP